MQKTNITHHPKALWFISISQIFYVFAFGSITSLLILYLIHNLHIPSASAYTIYAAMSALLYVLPLAGGYIGEKFGYVLTIILGYLAAFIGFNLLSVSNTHLIYLGIAFFAAGNAFITPNTNALIGLHYEKDSVLRNSAYTLYFMIYNIGFLVSPVVAGFVSVKNTHLVFVIGAINVMMGLLIFAYCIKKIEAQCRFSIAPQVHYALPKRIGVLIVLLLTMALGAFLLLGQENFDNKLLPALILFVIVGLLVSAHRKNRASRLKIFAFLVLCILSIAFWALYMLAPSFLTIFIAQNINRHVLGFDLPPSSYYALDALFVILLGFFFSWLWEYCARRKKDVSLPAKFASSLLAMGLSYLILAAGIVFADSATHLVNSLWVVLAYVFIAVGELLISPIALAMVGVLMPKGQEGLGMGIWQTFMGFAAIVSGFLANWVNTPEQGSAALTNPLYFGAFLKMGFCTVGIGVVILLLVPRIRRSLDL